jgi:hypothetical protein
MFNSKAEFQISIISGGKKTCVVRYPTDGEFADRARRQKIVRSDLGRGKSRTEAPNVQAVDAALFKVIRIDDGPPFSEAEASAVIDKLDRTELREFGDQGDRYVVTLRVAGAIVKHSVRVPKADERFDYRKASLNVVDSRRSTEFHASLEPGGILYDKLDPKAEGYDGDVPLNHKAAVVSEVLAQIALAEEESDDDLGPE